MQESGAGEVCLKAKRKLVEGILRGMRRRGMPANVDADDLRQEGIISIAEKGGPEKLLARIARNAMINALKRTLHGNRLFVALEVSGGGAVTGNSAKRNDAVFDLPVESLSDRHDAWEKERAERWA